MTSGTTTLHKVASLARWARWRRFRLVGSGLFGSAQPDRTGYALSLEMMGQMSLDRLKWLTIILPIIFLAALPILRFIVEQAREMLGSETAALCLAHGNGGGLTMVDCSGPRQAFHRLPSPVPPFPGTFLNDDEVPAIMTNPDCHAIEGGYRACHLSASLVVGSSRVGELCVSGRAARQFSSRQRELLAGMAGRAALALNNARLLERERYVAVLEERERLAQEMHDSLAQVLGYLHLKAQATKRHLNGGELVRADDELTDMASLAQEAYLDVRG